MNDIEKEKSNLTAEQYLSDPYFYQSKKTLDMDPEEPDSSDKTQAIQDAIFCKGLKPKERFLAPGEFERMITILSSEYPKAFNAWLGGQLGYLQEKQKEGRGKKWLTDADQNTFPIELRPFIEEKKEYGDVINLVVWT